MISFISLVIRNMVEYMAGGWSLVMYPVWFVFGRMVATLYQDWDVLTQRSTK